MKPLDPIAYDYSGLIAPKDAPPFVRQTGLAEADLNWLAPRLAAARQEVLDDLALVQAGRAGAGGIAAAGRRLLRPARAAPGRRAAAAGSDHRRRRPAGEGGRSGAGAGHRRLVHGRPGAVRGLLPSRTTTRFPAQRRGGRPRIYFEGNNLDNDAVQGLLDLVEGSDDWGIIVISKSGGTLETAVAFRIFFEALRKACGGDVEKLRRRVIAVTGASGRLRELAAALGCTDVFPIPDGVGGRYSVLSAVGLLPAAVMGLDVSHLLEGAAAMNERFRTAPPLENPALDYAGMSRLMETRRGATIRVLSTWGKGLEAVGLWYDQLLSESLGKNGQGATPLTVVNTRDLHSRGQQHQEGRRDKLITNLVVEKTHREWMAIERSEFDQDNLNSLSGKTLPDMLEAAYAGTNQAYAEDFRRTATIRLPRLDEGSLGQLFQMLMLATVVEGRLVGINPYGQPGVEAYKKNMNAILRKT